MSKWSSLSPQHRKLALEVGVLLVIFVAFITFSIYSSLSSGASDEPTLPSRLNTEFNTGVLEDIRGTDDTRPDYNKDTGKPNPFTY